MTKKILSTVPLICWVVLIFAFSNQSFESQTIEPGLQQYITEEQAKKVVPDVMFSYANSELIAKQEPFRFIEFVFRKMAHLFTYAVLGIFLWLALIAYINNRNIYGYALSLLIIIATMDEMNQYFMASRTGVIEDVFLDTFGGIIGLSLVYIVQRVKKSRKQKYQY